MSFIKNILKKVKSDELSLEEAETQLKLSLYETVGDCARLDIHRMKRIGIPEAILAEGKPIKDLLDIIQAQVKLEGRAIVTRVNGEQYERIKSIPGIKWHERAKIAVIYGNHKLEHTGGVVGIISAGTADIAVAEEAAVIAQEMGCKIITIYDVGVAGIHRLFPELSKLIKEGVDSIVVAAGREGTLPAIISGLVDVPVIGLPVSTGYGRGGGGEAALLSMLQSCSVMAVVNIDAGFVAGAFAAKIANNAARLRKNV